MKGVLFFILTLLTTSTQANNFNFVVSGGITTGGDTLAETDKGFTLKSGGLIYFAAGGIYELPESNLQIQSALGYHFDTLSADNGDADFDRIFLDIIPFYKFTDTFRAGIGLSKISSIGYEDPFDSFDFKNETATVMELNWGSLKSIWWGLRVAKAEYAIDKINGTKVNSDLYRTIDGDYIGVSFHLLLK